MSTRLTTNDDLRRAKRDWALEQQARERRERTDLIAGAVKATITRIQDDHTLGGVVGDRTNQLRGVRRTAAHLCDALAGADASFDREAFLAACGYATEKGK